MDSVLDEVRSVIGDVLDRGDGSWRALQEAGLLALAAPKEHGGEDLGLAEVAVLLHEVGRRAVELPVWETLACGLLPLVRSGSEALQADLVPKVLAGELLLAPALGEPGAALPSQPDDDVRRRGRHRHQDRRAGPRRDDIAARLRHGRRRQRRRSRSSIPPARV